MNDITSSTQSFIHKILFTFSLSPLFADKLTVATANSTRVNKHQQRQHHYGKYWIFQEILFENSTETPTGVVICPG